MSGRENIDRYSRQVRFAPLGPEGQIRLRAARAAIAGCGALGTVIANGLVRAGVGFVRIIDRDLVEWSNLQRQVLFEESDAARASAKADAAAQRLARINSEVSVEPAVVDLDYRNIDALLGDVDVVFDGTDNFETRFLINDYCHREKKPWVYGGAVGSSGQMMTIIPGKTPCLRCIVEEIPPPGTMPTCETAGILAPASMVIGSLQVMDGIKLLSGHAEAVTPGLFVMDLWSGRIRRMNLDGLREDSDCPICHRGAFSYLQGRGATQSASLCGREAVQIVPSSTDSVDWDRLHERLTRDFEVTRTPFLLRFSVDGCELSVFRDGRAIIRGTDDLAVARSIYARYIGT